MDCLTLSAPPPLACDSPRMRRLQRGMTMLEIMIVIGIIAVLVVLSIPAIGHFKKNAKSSAVTEQLGGLSMSLENYFQDFNVYPPSAMYDANKNPTPAYQVPPAGNAGLIGVGRGSAMLAEALTGYLIGTYDGAGEAGSFYPGESVYGFRTKGNASTGNATGKIYGPYAPVDKLVDNNPGALTAPDTDQSFFDIYGNEILYFRSTRAGNDNTGLPPVTQIFGTDTTANNYYFYADDNSVPAPKQLARQNPMAAKKEFFKLLGATSNGIGTTASAVPGAHSYLLMSVGPDGIAFTGDDIIFKH
jgi:prepilin-type N-terminal cleavage/methylation domain-containing protein